MIVKARRGAIPDDLPSVVDAGGPTRGATEDAQVRDVDIGGDPE
jgi:hypothetical protein